MEFTKKNDWKNNDKSGPDKISNAFCTFFTNVGPNYATVIYIFRIAQNVTQTVCP